MKSKHDITMKQADLLSIMGLCIMTMLYMIVVAMFWVSDTITEFVVTLVGMFLLGVILCSQIYRFRDSIHKTPRPEYIKWYKV